MVYVASIKCGVGDEASRGFVGESGVRTAERVKRLGGEGSFLGRGR